MGVVGAGLMAWMTVLKIMGDPVGSRPALLIGVFMSVVAVQMVSLGLIAELVVNLRRRRNLDAAIAEDVL